jgi:hypothetical protein
MVKFAKKILNKLVVEYKIFYWNVYLSIDKISQQPENCENRNDPDLVQAFLKKWWVESDFTEL